MAPIPHAEILSQIGQLRQQIDGLEAAVARQALEETAPAGDLDIVVCRIGADRFALPLGVVERAEMMCSLVPIPEAPPWIPGLLNLHGSLVPVLDTAARFARKDRPADPDDFIVICRSGEGRLGLVVQEVGSLTRIGHGSVRPVAADLPLAPYVVGVLEVGGNPVFLLSVACLRSASEVPETPE